MKIVAAQVKQNKHGYYELVDKPTQADLQAYYAEKYYQAAAGSYEVTYSESEITYFNNKIAQKFLAAQSHLVFPVNRAAKFLDVGAGEGWALKFFADSGWDCIGLDYSDFGCAAHNPGILEYLVAGDIYQSLRGLISDQRRFDLILLDNVLEHVLEPSALLVELRDLLEPNGVLMIEVPNDFSILQAHLMEFGHIDQPFWVVSPDHISYFGPDSLASLVKSAGLDVKMLMTDFPIDLALANPLTNYVRDRSVGKACHKARVEIENLLHAISPEKTNTLYQALADLGLGREVIAICSKAVQ
ncbi:class I SAM-dependent methyltransferase [Methylomonas sp. EFPC3]|uniref:class I SAM-dependent methyltransferase n=1 Tax=Methylomonas sp. EFPC3 TaxID=3021710 RepID=UPI0024166664|nr:class I SAM-dependent methyltransferase [Methylomonas sp. EFPC3]WFP50630.1 class I SAM-dependent methyltransferase [Methylomonas sp. EFPC3]